MAGAWESFSTINGSMQHENIITTTCSANVSLVNGLCRKLGKNERYARKYIDHAAQIIMHRLNKLITKATTSNT